MGSTASSTSGGSIEIGGRSRTGAGAVMSGCVFDILTVGGEGRGCGIVEMRAVSFSDRVTTALSPLEPELVAHLSRKQEQAVVSVRFSRLELAVPLPCEPDRALVGSLLQLASSALLLPARERTVAV